MGSCQGRYIQWKEETLTTEALGECGQHCTECCTGCAESSTEEQFCIPPSSAVEGLVVSQGLGASGECWSKDTHFTRGIGSWFQKSIVYLKIGEGVDFRCGKVMLVLT